jgi:hypothetical protein
MYTGTLIDDLMATVQQAEEQVQAEAALQDDELLYRSAPAPYELGSRDQDLLGVA